MLRKDTNAGFYTPQGGCLSQSKGDTKVFNTGGRGAYEVTYTTAQYEHILRSQMNAPVDVAHAEGKVWWLYLGECYWDDEGRGSSAVQALILERLHKEQRKVDKLKRQHGIE
jgi:hypothetical protein